MKGLIRGAAGLAVVLAMSACNKDETIDLMGPPTGVQATPISAFTSKGDSVAILLRLVNDRNQSVPTEFTIGNVGPALSVAYDVNYRPDYSTGDTLVPPAVKPQQRYFAKGANIGKSTFTATAGGFTTTVTVVVQPKSLEGAALSKTTGLVAGDTVTITAPAGLKFTPGSVVTLATGSLAVASRAADSSSIKVILGPGAGGIVTVTGVLQDYAPTLATKTLATTNAITATPAVTVAPTTVSTAAPAFGAPMTVTLGGGLRFTSTSTITIGGRTAYILTRSADSSTATIVPFGGSNGNVAYTNVVLSFLNGVALAVPGDKTVTVGPVTNDPNALAKATASTVTLPAVGETLIFSDGSPYPNNAGCAGAGGGDGCRWYKFVLAAPLKVDMELKWDPGVSADMGIYSENGGATFNIDALGHDATQTESKTSITIPAGTTYWVNTYYAPGVPTFFHLKITGKP